MAAPLANADAKVAACIEQLEKRVPLVTEQPKVIVETTKQAVLSRVSPQLNKVRFFCNMHEVENLNLRPGNCTMRKLTKQR